MQRYLCVFWELDRHSFTRLEQLSRAASGSAFLCSSFHPHITLACYEQIDDRALIPYAKAFAQSTASFQVRFEEVGLLSSEIAACFPAYRGGLKTNYRAWHQRFGEWADMWTAPQSGLYTPHVSLYTGQGTVPRAAQLRIAQAFAPFEGQALGLAVSWVRGPDDFQVLARYDLKSSVAQENK